jgi:Arc/MetJ family transcription regulator
MASRSTKNVDVDAELLAKARDASSSSDDAEVVDRALRSYVGRAALEASQEMSELTEEEALRIAYEELHAMRNGAR